VGARHPPIVDKQRARSYSHIAEVVACPFMGAFEFADESAGYKTTFRLMILSVRFQISVDPKTQNPKPSHPFGYGRRPALGLSEVIFRKTGNYFS